jgi:hypothetical protein
LEKIPYQDVQNSANKHKISTAFEETLGMVTMDVAFAKI